MKLRPNSILQELVDEFQKARPTVLQLGKDVQATRDGLGRGRKKRRLDDTSEEEVIERGDSRRRKTRSQNQRHSISHDGNVAQSVDDERDGDFQAGERISAVLVHPCR